MHPSAFREIEKLDCNIALKSLRLRSEETDLH